MRLSWAITAILAGLAVTTDAIPIQLSKDDHAARLSKQLQAGLKIENLKHHLQEFQKITDANGKTRVFGSEGHNATLRYVESTVLQHGYDVFSQDLTFERAETVAANAVIVSPTAGDSVIPIRTLSYTASTPAEGITASLFVTPNLGCSEDDYTGAEGKIVLVSRGQCPYGEKSHLASKARAVGAIIYNNVADQDLTGTLGFSSKPVVPTGGVTLAQGERLAALASASIKLTLIENRRERATRNLCVQTKGGNQKNVVMFGTHSDSVPAGPGINDNGSGSAALLELLILFREVEPVNAVRFCWWTAEEFGLLGAKAYVESLSEEQRAAIALYLNFDMIASPNYYNGIYDGDGSHSARAGPSGSAAIEKLFQDYFTNAGEHHEASAFDGRSDYGPFIEAGIPAGGLFTGAEGRKTESQVAKYGGVADLAYDDCYHADCDDIDNINEHAFLTHSKAIGHALAVYSTSTSSVDEQKSIQAGSLKHGETKSLSTWEPGTLHGVEAA